MQQLFDILAHKLTLTNATDPQQLTNPQKDALLDQLIIEKKKEALRVLVETRLQQSIDSRRITEHEELSHILERTHKVMAIQDKELPFPDHENPLSAIVEMYIEFFTRQNCSHRAQEIANIHKKKLCPKGLLPSTLFNWFVEWTRKHFQEFLKTTIHSLYVDSRQPKIQPNSVKDFVEKQQRQSQCPYLSIQKKETIQANRSIEVTSHRQRRQLISLEVNQKKVEKIRMKSQSPSQKSLKLGSYESIQQEDCLPINKEVFYYAYAEEIQAMYKQFQPCVADLDMAFVRRLRKGGRRQQVKKRVKQVAANFIKHMTLIRESIDKYRKEYFNAHPQKKQRKQERKSTLERLGPSENASKTSHGVRSMSTEKIFDERRKNLISSLSKKHRYVDLEQQESQSNLLPCTQRPSKPKQETNNSHQHQRVIDISFSPPRHKNQSKFLVISSGYISAQLQIIQQKVKKIKAKASKQQQSLHRKKSLSKSKDSRSIQLRQQQLDLPYSSLPATISLSPASHLRLPKIRKGR